MDTKCCSNISIEDICIKGHIECLRNTSRYYNLNSYLFEATKDPECLQYLLDHNVGYDLYDIVSAKNEECIDYLLEKGYITPEDLEYPIMLTENADFIVKYLDNEIDLSGCKEIKNENCIICLDNGEESVFTLGCCSTPYHKSCFTEWAKKSKIICCAVCRIKLK